MSSQSILPSYESFRDVDGSPLEAGSIYVGDAGTQASLSPVSVYWDTDLTIPASQPISTTGGYPSNGGTPGMLYVAERDYSLEVLDKNGTTVYSALERTQRIQATAVSVTDYGAKGDGVTDDTASIQAAFNAFDAVFFPDGTYLCGAITVTNPNVSVDFGNAVLVNSGVGTMFSFGVSGDTFNVTGLRIRGGTFNQATPTTSSDYNYFRIKGTKDFKIAGCTMNNVSNGGIIVEAGCVDGIIDSVDIAGNTNNADIRGIWIAGSTASDFAGQLVDTNSITRNATAVPVYYCDNIKVVNCTIKLEGSGVYVMNARNTLISNCTIDISGSGLRCIALNNYSPNSIVSNNQLIGSISSTGILVTQVSTGVTIETNKFSGTFAGGRAIYVQYLGEAIITGNHFLDTSTQNIQVNMGGFAVVRNNYFFRSAKVDDQRAVYMSGIDPAAAGTAIGSTGTVLANAGLIFTDNVLKKTCLPVFVDNTIADAGGNEPCPEHLHVSDNVAFDMDLASTGSEYLCNVVSGTSGNDMQIRLDKNVVYPYDESFRNTVLLGGGTDYVLEHLQTFWASFNVVVTAGGGAITVTRTTGANFSLAVNRSGTDLALTPRTQLGAAGASVPQLFAVEDNGGAATIGYCELVLNGTNYDLIAYDNAGVAINFTTAGVNFRCIAGPVNAAT